MVESEFLQTLLKSVPDEVDWRPASQLSEVPSP